MKKQVRQGQYYFFVWIRYGKYDIRDSSDRLQRSFRIRHKHHLHRKAQVLPCELWAGAACRPCSISRSDLQCFSHEDGCFEPVKRTPRAACL